MYKYLISLYWILPTLVLAQGRSIFLDSEGNGIKNENLRKWDMKFEDIPWAILAIINNLLSFVAYFSLFVIIVGGLMYILWGVKEDMKTKGKQAVQVALIWAVVSWSGWIIVNFVFDNF